MVLTKIMAGLSMIASLNAGPDSTALEQRIIEAEKDTTKTVQVDTTTAPRNEYKLRAESALNIEGTPFRRIELSNNDWKLTYDQKKQVSDIASISFDGITKDKTVGASLYNIKKSEEADAIYAEAWKAGKTGLDNYLLAVGGGAGKDMKPEYFILGRIENNNLFMEAALFNNAKDFLRLKDSFYGVISADLGKIYAGTGLRTGTHTGFLGIKGFENFGSFTFATYNPATNEWFFKSQTGIGDVDQKFFSKKTFDFGSSYITVPPFLKLKLSPPETKGAKTVSFEGFGKGDVTELEAMVGVRTPIIAVGAGIRNRNTSDGNVASHVFRVYAPFSFRNFSGALEAKYNGLTKSADAYIILNYNVK